MCPILKFQFKAAGHNPVASIVMLQPEGHVRLNLASLTADRQLWARVIDSVTQLPTNELPKIADAAFEALDHWSLTSTSDKDMVTSSAIDGAFSAIGQFITAHPKSAYATCRRAGTYFLSRNINVSFTAIRRFECKVFSDYAIYVSDLLVHIASSDTVIPSPIELTLRGNAFWALFQLDPQYKHWPQLQIARNECVHGLLTWGSGNDRCQSVAQQIMRYVTKST